MSESTTPEQVTKLVREFMAGLRAHIKAKTEGEPEVVVERVFGAIAALGAGILLVVPSSRRGERLVAALIAFAMKYLTSRGAKDARD